MDIRIWLQTLQVQVDSNTAVAMNRTNEIKKMAGNTMTWGTLVFLLKKILIVRKVSLDLTITKDKKDTVYHIDDITEETLLVIWKKMKVDFGDINKSIDAYILRNKDIPSAVKKTNLKKKVNTSSMSWKNFIFLITKVIEASQLVFELSILHRSGEQSKHSIKYKIKDDDE